uniref:Uncharacterized protein n=1 Tax=Oryza nivara TaxID=4536 RepID=A0A0E0FPN1_ORYNI
MDGTNPMLSIPSHLSLPNLEVPIPARPVLILATGGGCSSHRRHPRVLDGGVGQKEVFGVVQVPYQPTVPLDPSGPLNSGNLEADLLY